MTSVEVNRASGLSFVAFQVGDPDRSCRFFVIADPDEHAVTLHAPDGGE